MKSLRKHTLDAERAYIVEALRTTYGNVRAAAALLGATERTLWNRIKYLKIDRLRDSRPSSA